LHQIKLGTSENSTRSGVRLVAKYLCQKRFSNAARASIESLYLAISQAVINKHKLSVVCAQKSLLLVMNFSSSGGS